MLLELMLLLRPDKRYTKEGGKPRLWLQAVVFSWLLDTSRAIPAERIGHRTLPGSYIQMLI